MRVTEKHTEPWIAILILALVMCAIAAQLDGAAPPWERPDWSAGEIRGDDCDTRCEVLGDRCSAVYPEDGLAEISCRDAYSGRITSRPASKWQVDHEIPASVVWRSRPWHDAHGQICGAVAGCSEFLRWYNEKENLSITTPSSNASKGALLPRAWCPGSAGDRKALAASVRRTARVWSIPLSAANRKGLAAWGRGECLPGQRVIGGGR